MGVPELRIIPDESLEPLVMNYTLPSHFESWKHEIADRAAQKATEAGIEPKYIVAALMLESGINPEAVGDGGKSKGVLQVNESVHGTAPDTDGQIEMWLNNFSEAYGRSGSWEYAVTDWNSPKYAPYYWQTKYFKNYQSQLNKISI